MSGPTDKQREARARNWRVRCLRGLYTHGHHLDPDLAAELRAVVDRQLARLGAETEAARRIKLRAKLDEIIAQGQGKGMPF